MPFGCESVGCEKDKPDSPARCEPGAKSASLGRDDDKRQPRAPQVWRAVSDGSSLPFAAEGRVRQIETAPAAMPEGRKSHGSIWYIPQACANDQHGKLLLMAPSYDRSGAIGFRCVKDAD